MPRCLLCGMHCLVGVARDRFEHLRAVFPADMRIDQGACVLGLTAGRLISADERVFASRMDGEEVPLRAALEALATRLKACDPARIALIVDVNRPVEGIASAHALAGQVLPGSSVSAFVPPQDAAVAEAGVSSMPPLAQVAERSLVVTVGDVCSSHPAITRLLRDMQRAERSNRWLSIDVAPSRTTRAADEAVVIRPEALAAFACAVAVAAGADDLAAALGESDIAAICQRAGLSRERVEDLAARIGKAEKPGFVVSSSLGRYSHAAGAVAAVGALAGACDGLAWVLPLCMNSFALPTLATSLELRPMGRLQEAIEGGRVDALVLVGFDPGAAFPERVWRAWLDRPEMVAWAGSLSCEFADAAGIAIPLALGWEESGSMVCRDGKLATFEPWACAPDAVPAVAELMKMVAAAMGAEELQPVAVAEAIRGDGARPSLADLVRPAVLDVPAVPNGCVAVVGAPEPQGYTGGLNLAQSPWQARVAGEEAACCPVATPGWAALGDPPGIAVACRPPRRGPYTEEWTELVAAVPAHWPAARELLDWQVSPSGALVAEPRAVPMVTDG
jgi:hypothetical protein